MVVGDLEASNATVSCPSGCSCAPTAPNHVATTTKETRRTLRESLPMSHPLIPSTLCVDRTSPLPAPTALGTSHSRHAPPHAVDGFLHDVARQASALSMLREVSLQAPNQVGDDRGAMPRSVRHTEPLPRRWAIQPEGWRTTRRTYHGSPAAGSLAVRVPAVPRRA